MKDITQEVKSGEYFAKAIIGDKGTSFIGRARTSGEMAVHVFNPSWLITLNQAGRLVMYYILSKGMYSDVVLDDEADMILSLEACSKKINSVTIRRGINELLKNKILIEVSDTKRLYKWA